MWRGVSGFVVIAVAVLGFWTVRSVPDEPTALELEPSTTSTSSSTQTTEVTTSRMTSTTTTTTMVAEFAGHVTTVDAEGLAHSWHEGCPVGPEELALVTVTHRGFDGAVRQGELVIHVDHAEAVLGVFETLFEVDYPIESVIPIGDLPPDAESDPEYANTSGFHCRTALGSSNWSEHARGLAIDINPHLNPYVRGDRIEPSGAGRYTDRSLGEPGMITDGDEVVRAFEAIGWHWGGYWRSLKDYHHFSATGR